MTRSMVARAETSRIDIRMHFLDARRLDILGWAKVVGRLDKGGFGMSTRNNNRSRHTGMFSAGTRSVAAFLSVVIAVLVLPALALQPTPAAAYDVCDDDGSCVHEYISQQAAGLFSDAEIQADMGDIINGSEHEDIQDHVFGYYWIGGALVTITHFWDADAGVNDSVEMAFGSFPNAWQKVTSLWSMALGHYATGNKGEAYHYLGHVAHLLEDMSLPTHVHDDMHFPDDDAFEDWMSDTSHVNRDLSPAEMDAVRAAGPIAIPASQPDKLFYLMHTTNQISDFFASDDYDGDAVDPLGWVQPELDAMSATITSPRFKSQLEDNDAGDDNNDGDLGRIRQHSYLRSFRVVAALYKLFAETVANPITSVVIDRVEELDDHDEACVPFCFETSNPDFYARVQIGDRMAQNRGNYVTGDEVIHPAWPFGNVVGTTGSVPVRIEIWEHDGAWASPATFSGDDDVSDVGPGGDRGLDLTVDLAKCLAGADGAVSGELSGKCGVPLTAQGDADDDASRVTFTIQLTKATPVISTQASPSNLLGAPVRDTATLTGGANPTGTVTFRLFSDNACANQVFTSTNPVTGSLANSDWFTPGTVGTYYWTAEYPGDVGNNAAVSGCNAPNESVAITPFQPPPVTRTITGDLLGPVTVNAGESVLIENARVVGPVTVNPGGALTVTSSKISRGIVANAPGFLSVCGTDVSGPAPNPALGVSNAPVPIRIGDPANACPGNRFAGHVNLHANVAVTFGANGVSHGLNVDNGGPGNTVIKANTVLQTLACAGNSPPPINSGQGNRAQSRTGQCAML